MATESGHAAADLIDELFAHPRAFDFFQAVRLLELADRARGDDRRVGMDNVPDGEVVRFHAHPSLAFAPTEVRDLETSSESARAEMQTTFLGLVGTTGTLPQHYTGLAIERGHLKDPTLRDFLDVFHHRILSLFYRAWCKYRLPVAFERRKPGEEDAFTQALCALVGLGYPAVRDAQAIDDTAFAFESGHFARQVRTAVGLEDLLEDLFGAPARVEPFAGRWLELPEQEWCRLPLAKDAGDVRVQLGGGATLGARLWDVQGRVRVHLGPLSLETFEHLSPGGRGHSKLLATLKAYLGPDLDFALEFILAENESPGTRLVSSEGDSVCRLGGNSWLEHAVPVSATRTASFPLDGF